MKTAAIDIGTNSIRLLILEHNDSSFKALERKMEITRIGKNLDSTGNISSGTALITSEVLKKYKSRMEKHDVGNYRAVGTSSVRKASNSSWFISYIKENTGIEIEKITGEEEAHLSFSGATKLLDTDSRVLVMDIGGGSTEFILGSTDIELELNKSINIGSVSLSEKFIKGDRPDDYELSEMRSYIRNRVRPTLERIRKKNDLILMGVAGTITTIAAIDLKLEEYDSTRIHHHTLTGKNVLGIYNMLCGLSLRERRRVKGLQPERADIIIGGTAVLLEALASLEKDSLIVSEQDILDGIIYSLIKF